MFGVLHSDVTSFWSFEKLVRISHQDMNYILPSTQDFEYGKILTEAKNDLLRCHYRARWFYKTSSDIFI